MPVRRELLAGPPHRYWLRGGFVLDGAFFEEEGAAATFLELLDEIRILFDARLYAWRLEPTGYRLVLGHRDSLVEDDRALQRRWRNFGGGAVAPERLRRRLTSLGGLMQLLTQTFSRRHNRRTGRRGSLWQPRYRSCLLADDSALLAAIAAVERSPGVAAAVAVSGAGRGCHDGSPRLAAPPLCELATGLVLPLDRAPTAMSPPTARDEARLLDAWMESGVGRDLPTYVEVLERSWALGLAESLAEVSDRLGRGGGRGRARRLRELDDEQGLCGLWG